MSRETRQRRAIRRAFEESRRPVTPQEILQLATTDCPSLGLATVYRALKSLSTDGDIVPVELPGDATRYELADRAAHHYFRCAVCQRVFSVNGATRPPRYDLPPGFQVDHCEMLLRGRCADCSVV